MNEFACVTHTFRTRHDSLAYGRSSLSKVIVVSLYMYATVHVLHGGNTMYPSPIRSHTSRYSSPYIVYTHSSIHSSIHPFTSSRQFAFRWACEPTQRNIGKDMAVALLPMLVSKDDFPQLDQWCTFLTEVRLKKNILTQKKTFETYTRYNTHNPFLPSPLRPNPQLA